MRPLDRRVPASWRSCRPRLEGLEARDLPSVAAPPIRHGIGEPRTHPGLRPDALWAVTTTSPIKIGNQVFPPGTYAVPQPTGREIHRQLFTAALRRTVRRQRAPVLQPGRHDPHLQ